MSGKGCLGRRSRLHAPKLPSKKRPYAIRNATDLANTLYRVPRHSAGGFGKKASTAPWHLVKCWRESTTTRYGPERAYVLNYSRPTISGWSSWVVCAREIGSSRGRLLASFG
ncbi:predicted protein [Histoplasma capsulatum H143]|uniref:Uncharacterized protein n=1 Tax=Ajellomyces capsulatus (strain H143) TaxID=544712 RepID=C6H212_AJECH|nr:predicted protein [Histoplasma capsulatum H143]